MPGIITSVGLHRGVPTQIPITDPVELSFAVYYTPTYPPLGEKDLRERTPAWIDAHVGEPLRSTVKQFLPQLWYIESSKSVMPQPPKEGVGAEEAKRLDAGYQVITVNARDPNRVPRVGLWAALASAYAAVEALNGVASDQAALRLLPLQPEPIPAYGEVSAARFVRPVRIADAAGQPWLIASGVSKFGFADLQMPQIEGGEALLLGTAQYLLDTVLRMAAQVQPVPAIEVGPILMLDPATLARGGVGYAGGGAPQVVLEYLPAEGARRPLINGAMFIPPV